MDTTPLQITLNFLSGINIPFFQTQEFLLALFLIKVIFIFVSFFLFFHIIYLIYKLLKMQGRFRMYKDAFVKKTPPPFRGEFAKRWMKIEQRMDSMQEAEYKLAIIEADKIFDDLLKRIGCKGKDMHHRLKSIDHDLLPSINKVWRSHKVRNNIAHNPDYHIGYDEAKIAIENYKDALKELRILD